jgi:peptidoglycan/LPS O-acetylase OafA/YrhL
MSRSDDKFQQHIHVFRGVAIILIVCAHTVPSLDWSANPVLGKFIDAAANESSMFFFFIAGYLFQYLSGRFAFDRYLSQKLNTVILPYVILSVPALIIFTFLVRRTGMWPWFYDLPAWGQIGLFLATGKHLAPLWFVPTITLFYLAAPVFLFIDRKFRFGYWLIVPLLILSATMGRGGQLGPLNFALYLLPVYMLGMVFCHYRVKAIELVARWSPVLLLIAGVAIAGIAFEWASPPHWQVPLKVSLALLITLWLWKYHGLFGKRLDYIAEVSFGIFFVHAYFIAFIKSITFLVVTGGVYKGEGAEVIPGNPLTFVAYAGSVLAISVAVIWVAKKIFGIRSRMVIGA